MATDEAMIVNSTMPTTTSASVVEAKEPLASTVIRLTLSCLVFLLNVVGNTMVCIVVKRNRKLRSFRNYYYGLFLVNLSVADLTVAIICMPFILLFYETAKYPFGFFGSTAVCKLIPTLSLMCQGASVFSLTSLTLQRFVGIVYPMKARLTLVKVKLVLALVWLLAFFNALPVLITQDSVKTPSYNQYSCDEVWSNEHLRQGYTLYLFISQYLLPLIIISVTYSKMAWVLCNRDKEFEGKKSHEKNAKVRHMKFIRLLIVLVVTFALCFLPNHVLFFWLENGSGGSFPYFLILMKYSHLCIWLNSFLNPYLYGALDECFGQGYKKVLRSCARFERKTKMTHSRITKQLSRMYSLKTVSTGDDDDDSDERT
ncbi:predicted protein [Nematostella vectensis]|uniref:G-protein coupled receptors family 1 profile domain-containing protein n=1 Tax=Nematostella vectensis TaxID=45351 RepID=A7RZ25_NEMVE|nr:predicted protein [Nematostella vectensis]|eukprot:XP_001635396.1 predicted protein [Nematostella vectensis]